METRDLERLVARATAPRASARQQVRRHALLVLLTVLVLLEPKTLQAAAPATDWWDTSYAWRRKITFTDSGTGTPSATVVSFTFDHASLVASGKSLASGNDVRVAYWNGATWTELPRSLANGSAWNNAATQIMIKTTANLATAGNNDNYYLYLGNPAAAAPPTAVPTARWYKSEQLVEQSTTSTTFVNVPGTTLTFTPGDASETWLVFVSGIMRSSSTTNTYTVEMQLQINGTTVDYWGHRTNNATTPNSAGFLIPVCISGTTATQTIQPQFRAGTGTSYVNTIRVVAALVPPGGDLHLAQNNNVQQLTGSNLSITSTTFTPPSAGNYLILGKVSHHETPSSSTIQSWVEDDAGGAHPDAPTGTHYSEGYMPWAPATTVFRRTLTAASKTFTLRGTSSNTGTMPSEWSYSRLIAVLMDAWEAAEYNEDLTQTTTTSTSFQNKVSLTTAAPPAARDYLIIQAQRMSGNSTSTSSSKSGELRDGGTAILRTDHRIGMNGSNTAGYHHTAGAATAKRTAASVTYDNGYLSPNAITVQCADSTITSLRYREAASALGADEPVPTVTWTAASQTVPEAGGSVTLTAQLSGVKSTDVTVPFTVTGTAASGTDYTIAASPLTIPAGNTTASITINILDDLIAQLDHTIIVTMGTPTGAAKGATTVHTVTIQDNDVAGVTVSKGSVNIAEGGATDTYTVTLNTQPTANVVITVTPDGQSSVGSGVGVARQLTFTPGSWNVAQTVTVSATDDPDIEGPHTSTITHTAASADAFYSGIGIAGVTANITDNDTAGVIITESGGSTDVVEGGATDTYTVVLHSRPAADVVVTVTPDAQSSVGAGAGIARQLVFTYGNWNIAQTVTVTATDNPDVDGPHTSTITHTAASTDANYNSIAITNVTAHITDNDTAGITVSKATVNVTEGGATDTYTVVLHSRPAANVTVTVTPDAMSSVGAGNGIARQLTFTSANWNVTQTVTVIATDDAVAEGLHTSTITHTASSSDANYNGIAIASVTANITDNDIAYVNFSLAAQSASETDGAVTVDITLSVVASHDVTVPFTLSGTAATPANYTITASPVTIPAGQISTTITITIIDDFINNPDRTVILTMGNPTNATKGTQTVHTLTILDNEPPGVTIREPGGSTSVTEAGATDSYTVVLQSQPLADVTIAVNTDGKTTVNPASLIFTAANWNIPQAVTVTAVDNLIAEGPHSSVITHTATSTDADYNGIAVSNVTVTIIDNDTAGVVITESGGSTNVTEGGATDTYTVVLHSQPTANVTINIATDGKATVSPTSLTFTAGNWSIAQTVTVTAVDDAAVEGLHTSTITHTAASADGLYSGIAIACVVANITDNDTAGVIITESGGSTTVTEGGATDSYTLVLRSQPLANVTIAVNTDGKVMVNPVSLTFTAANWNVAQTVTVTAVDDVIAEGLHTSTITHTATSADGNYNAIAVASVAASIQDNDSAGVTITESGGSTNVTEGGATDSYTAVLNTQPTADVTITIATDGRTTVSPTSLIFTAGNWNIPQTVTVTAVDDTVAQGPHTSTITHTTASADPSYSAISVASVAASVTDNDSAGVTVTESGGSTNVTEGGATDTYTVALHSQPTADVTIAIATDGKTTVNPTSLTFSAADWNTSQTVTVTAVDDVIAQGAHTSTITHTATSADGNYNAIAIASITANITDNDTADVTVSKANVSVTEGGATDTYTVVLHSQPTGNVTITVATDGKATVNPVSLTFTAANWNSAQTVTVTAVDDAVAEGLHTSTITHTATSADGNYNAIAIASVTDNITDNDTAGVTVSKANVSVTEGGATDTYTVVLHSQPTGNVTITVATDGKATANPVSLTFTAANWNSAQTVTVTAVDDAVAEGLHTSTITHTATSADSNYNAIAIASVTANITDNDTADVTVSKANVSVTEGGATDTYTVVLHSQPTGNVTITVATDGKATVNPVSLTFTAANWNSAQTVTVTAVDDAVAEGLHTSTITHTATSADGNYNALAIASVAANITDNDTAGVTVTESGGSTNVTEGGATDTYTVVLHSQPTSNVIVNIATDGNTTVNPTSLTFTAGNWNTPQVVTVTAVDDAIAQGPRTSTITHTAASVDPNYNGIAIASVTTNITDNDTAGVTITESGGSTNVTEGGATDTYTVVLHSQPIANVTITIATDGQTTVSPALLTFTAGNWNIAQTVTVTAVNDAIAEGPHTSTITHTASSSDSNYDGIAIASVTTNITDNDTAGVIVTESGGSTNVTEGGATDSYTIVLHSQPAANVTVTITPDGNTTVNPTSLTFTPANWNVAQTVTVTAVDDSLAQGLHTSTITHTATSADGNYNAIAIASVMASVQDNDTASVIITESGGSTNVTEGGATDTYSVVLSSQPTATVTITIATDGQTTVNPATLTFTPVNWNVSRTVTVTAVDDAIAEGPRTSTITHTVASGDANYNGIAIASVAANITDNDIAYVNFSLAAQSAWETAGSATVDVTLSTVSTHDVIIPFTLSGTAATPANYTIAASPVTIPAGQLSATITITIVDDFINNPDRTVILTMGNPTNGTKGTLTVHTLTILDNEPPGVAVSESGGSTSVTEGGATDTYALVLQSQPLADVTIAITTDGKTTVNPTSVTFTAANWNMPQAVTVAAVDDSVAEGLHSSVISHTATSADTDYDGIAISNVTVTITDNDTAGVNIVESGGSTDVVEGGATDTYTVVLNTQPLADVTIAVTTDGQTTVNPASLTFTAGNWNMPQTVTVTAVDNAMAEGPHTSTITHAATSSDVHYNGVALAIASITVHITDNDTAGVTITESGGSTNVTEGGVTDTYTMALHSQPTVNVTIAISTDGQTTVSPTSVTFTPANWNTARTVTVTAVDDAVAQGPHTSTITHTAGSGDTNYNGIAIADVTVSITDNDSAGVIVTESGGSTNVAEGGATDSYTVVLHSQPIANVTITISTDSQVTVNPASLIFTPGTWNVPQTVTVTAVNDAIAQGPRTSTITHTATSADTNYQGIPIADVTVNVADDDVPGVMIIESGGSTAVTEGGASDTYTVVLQSQPVADVTITIANDANITVSPTSLTFTPANWSTLHTVTVTAVDDALANGLRTSTITHAAVSTDPNYNAIAIASITVSVADNDTTGVTITESNGSTSVTEGGAADTYTVALQSQPLADVIITLNADTQITVSPTSLTFTPANWNVPQTVAVAAVEDAIAQGTRACVITHTVASADPKYDGLAVNNVTVTITDNDTAGVTITETDGSTRVTEGGQADSYTVALNSKPTAGVTIAIATDGRTTVSPTSLTFTASTWNIPQTVTVAAVDNAVAEGLHTSTITHNAGSADGNYNGIAITNITAIITDNDTAGITVTPTTGLVTSEAGDTATFTIVLNSQPTADVTIGLTSSDLTEGTVCPSSMTFTPANWNVPQVATVTGVDDLVQDGDVNYTIITSAAISADPTYNGLDVQDISVTNRAWPAPGVTIWPPNGMMIDEVGGTASFTMVLNCPPTADVTIELSSSDPTQGAVSPSSITFTPSNWNQPQTVTVQRLDLQALQGSTSFHVVLSPAVSTDPAYNAKVPAGVQVTNNRSNEDIQIEVHRTIHYGVCGPVGYAPLVLAIQGFLGMKMHGYGRRKMGRRTHSGRD